MMILLILLVLMDIIIFKKSGVGLLTLIFVSTILNLNQISTIINEILRIVSFSSYNFESDDTKLSMLVKKNHLEKLDNFKFKKLFYYLGSPLHLITHNMDASRKSWNIK